MAESNSISRVFICCNDPYPFGTANSNYIRNLSLLTTACGYETHVIGLKEYTVEPTNARYDTGIFEGVKFTNIQQKKSNLPFRMKNHFFFGKKLQKILNQYSVNDSDCIILYTDFISASKFLLKKYRNLNEKGHLIYCIVEWFQAHQFSMSFLSLDYLCWKIHFDRYMPKYRKIIPISSNLAAHFKKFGVETCILPCLVDCNVVKSGRKSIKHDAVIDLIYPGAATNKDDLESMIKGLMLLPDNELHRIRLHFTTMNEEKLKKTCHCNSTEYERIKTSLFYHGWMERDELLRLYEDMDFLFIARQNNIITRSNFPSKVPEMLCYGTIPLCSDVGDYTTYYLEDMVNSLIFEGSTPAKCAEAIKRALNLEPSKIVEMKVGARKCAEQQFDYRNWTVQMKNFLESINEDK